MRRLVTQEEKANKHMKEYSASLEVREIEIK